MRVTLSDKSTQSPLECSLCAGQEVSIYPLKPNLDNGGDGFVAARHLKIFGYSPSIYYPKQTDKDLYKQLIKQCKSLDIPMIEELPKDINTSYDIILDSIFGFSFKGEIREPFKTIIEVTRMLFYFF